MRLLTTRARAAGILAAVALLAAGCGGDDDDKGAFQKEVVSARDTADSSFAYIKRPESTEDLIRRLRTSGDRLQRVSGSVAEVETPDDLVDEQERLAQALREMSKEMDAAANSIEFVQEGDSSAPVETLIFDTWDAVQAALTDLRNQGIDVQPLRPGGGA
jgi:hypothetical protein